jgi:hypothetical protein
MEHSVMPARKFKMGRKRPVAQCPCLSFGNYLTKKLPAPPSSVDYSAEAASSLSEIYMNDQLGDCVIATIGHIVGTLTGNADGGQPFIYTNEQIVELYSAIGGYVPGNESTDQGCDEQTALNYWLQHGAPFGQHRIAGWMSVDGSDPTEYRTALWLFENLFCGVELPDAWVDNEPTASGFTWEDAGPPNPDNGHAFPAVAYNQEGITIATWGMTGLLTNGAMQKYLTSRGSGELYVVISQDAINKAIGKAPNGFDYTQLIADFDAMGGDVVL